MDLNIVSIAKVCDLTKDDLKKFEIGLTEAKKLKITKEDLKGITEIVPNKKYGIRLTTGSRKYFSFDGTLMDAIHEKKTYEKNMQIEPKQERLKNFELSFSDGIKLYFDDLYDRQKREDIDINTIYDHYKKN